MRSIAKMTGGATPRLTINLGLRWDVQPAATERYDRVSSVDTTVNNIWGTPGVIAFPGVNHYGRNLWNVKYTDLGPRLGAAYKITDTLVARGGWGIIYTPSNSGLLHGPFNFGSAPFSFYLNDIPYGTNPAGVPIGTFSDPAISIPTNKAGADPTARKTTETGSTCFRNMAIWTEGCNSGTCLSRRVLEAGGLCRADTSARAAPTYR